MEMAPASTSENSENSKTESVNPLSQALGPVTGVLDPRIYSSQKVLTDILGPLNSFKFHSLEKAPFKLSGKSFPVEVRDSSDGVLFRFIGRPTGQVVYDRGQWGDLAIYMAVLVDPLQRELLYAKPDIAGSGFDPGFNLTCRTGPIEQFVGKVNVPGLCACDATYRVTALNLVTNQTSGILMEAHGTGFNCCSFTSNTLLFGCPDLNAVNVNSNFSGSSDPRAVAELKRLSNSTSNNPNGASQVNFDQKLPIVHKIWILFICYHHHFRNFANTSCSRNGQRGSFVCYIHWLIWPIVVVFSLFMILWLVTLVTGPL